MISDLTNYFPYSEITNKGVVSLPNENKEIEYKLLPQFEKTEKTNQSVKNYDFIDLDKLFKVEGKSYKLPELKEIAKKLDIPITKKKEELVRLIKLKLNL